MTTTATRLRVGDVIANDMIEEAWLGGPWRRKGTGDGKPSAYVCARCRKLCKGVYRLPSGEWVDAECRDTLPRVLARLKAGKKRHSGRRLE
jgi:hypothetical protein